MLFVERVPKLLRLRLVFLAEIQQGSQIERDVEDITVNNEDTVL